MASLRSSHLHLAYGMWRLMSLLRSPLGWWAPVQWLSDVPAQHVSPWLGPLLLWQKSVGVRRGVDFVTSAVNLCDLVAGLLSL